MTAPGAFEKAAAHLRATLAAGKLPAAQLKRGKAVLDRLGAPVRIALFGLPGSGKTELLNLLAGQRLIPSGHEMPTLHVRWGAEWKATVTMADGSKSDIKWPTGPDHDWTDAVFLQVSAPVERLKSFSLLEVVSDGTPGDLSKAMTWAIGRTDLAIWCTQMMTELELALWVQVPDTLKDHGFLVLTKADQLAAAGELGEQIKALGTVAEEEFYGLYAVATMQYLGAIGADGAVDPKVRKSSGAAALIDAVMGDVRRGRQASLDAAEVFLSRHGTADAPAPQPEPQKPAPAAAPAAAKAPPAPKKPRAADAGPAVLAGLRELGFELCALDEGDDKALVAEVLATCNARFEDLVEKVAEAGGELADDIETAAEAIILMQLEGDPASAADAATVVLQLTRELELAQAA